MADDITLVVGYQNYRDFEVLQDGLSAFNDHLAAIGGSGRPIRIKGAKSNAQDAYKDALAYDADLMLLCPRIEGYHHGLINDLLLYDKKPIPVIGWIPPRSDDGRMMINNGAKTIVQLPMDEQGIAMFLQNAERVVNDAWRERAEGHAHYSGAQRAGAGDLSYERKTIAVWVPKGGGSTRTTIATNLAVALAHNALGGVPTVLVDLDMSKGDCHTLLGLCATPEDAARTGYPYVDRCMHTLVTWVANDYGRKGSTVDATLINRVLVNWRPGEAQLKLLPGLLSPAHAAAEEFSNWPMLYELTQDLLRELRRIGSFVICDLGQDFTVPLHRAALEEADEVIVSVPPARTAVVDTAHALPALRNQMGGNLNKFKLIITAYEPNFGMSEKEIVEEIGLPHLATIPFEPLVAHRAMNTCEPFVLTDDGPLGKALVELAAVYYPGMRKKRGAGLNLAGIFKRMVLREA